MSAPTIDELRTLVRGAVITADDPGYDEARAVQNGRVDRRPKAIVTVEQTADVVACVNHARDAGLPLAVRGGGHSGPGYGTNDDGLVIDLSGMRLVAVDPSTRRARVAGGATWGDVNHATHLFGLATPGGIVSTTGVGGLTLGGGIGYLTRKYGLSIDNLLSAEVVTADGRVRTASATQNPDLFWALRGGGGNFGVVTSFEFQLHPVTDVCVGLFFYELDVAADLLRFYTEFLADAPEEYGGYPGFHIAPPLEFIPQERHGDVLILAVVHWAGPLEKAEQAMQPFRDFAPRVAELVQIQPYPALNAAFDPIFYKGQRAYWKGVYGTGLPEPAVRVHVERGSTIPCLAGSTHVYPINGACHRVDPDATAFPYRNASFATVLTLGWADPAEDDANVAWVRDFHDALAPFSEPGGYVNFMDADDQGRVADNYGRSYRRLVEVKNTFDPDNLFQGNHNIPPRPRT